VLDYLDANSQRTLYLLIARTALVRGKVEMTDVAAERLLALTEEGSSDHERARLYRAAGRVVTAAHTEALLDLEKIEVARLPERDVELLTAARMLGRSVRKPLPEASAPPEPSGAKSSLMRPRIDFTAPIAAVNRAQTLLDESKEQLKERDR
jgi:chemotaxis protein MotC